MHDWRRDARNQREKWRQQGPSELLRLSPGMLRHIRLANHMQSVQDQYRPQWPTSSQIPTLPDEWRLPPTTQGWPMYDSPTGPQFWPHRGIGATPAIISGIAQASRYGLSKAAQGAWNTLGQPIAQQASDFYTNLRRANLEKDFVAPGIRKTIYEQGTPPQPSTNNWGNWLRQAGNMTLRQVGNNLKHELSKRAIAQMGSPDSSWNPLNITPTGKTAQWLNNMTGQ